MVVATTVAVATVTRANTKEVKMKSLRIVVAPVHLDRYAKQA
jgi:hypothetical protein